MPQIWLTYDELAQELGCDAEGARAASIAAGWTRKHSHDGFSRVLLPAPLMRAFCLNAALSAFTLDALADAQVKLLRDAATGRRPDAVAA